MTTYNDSFYMLTLFTPNPLPALFLTNIYLLSTIASDSKKNVCIDVPEPHNFWFSTLLTSLIVGWASGDIKHLFSPDFLP